MLDVRRQGGLQPVGFTSRKFSQAEHNYPTHERELLALVYALGYWRHYLLGVHFEVCTDNTAVKWLKTCPRLSPRQTRWLALIEYNFDIRHIPGKKNTVADPLSRNAQASDAIPQPPSVREFNVVSANDLVSNTLPTETLTYRTECIYSCCYCYFVNELITYPFNYFV